MPTEPEVPQVSAAMEAALRAASRQAIVGNFEKATALLEDAQRSSSSSDYDRFKGNLVLRYYHETIGNLQAAIGAERAILASPYFATQLRRPNDDAYYRNAALLRIATHELAMGDFDAAIKDADGASAAIQGLDDYTFPIGAVPERRAEARQIAQAALNKQSRIPEPDSGMPLTPRSPLIDPPLTTKRDKAACAAIVQHSNDGTLEKLAVPLTYIAAPTMEPQDGYFGSDGPMGARVDLFGNHHPVFVMSVNDIGQKGGSHYEIFSADGTRISTTASSDANDDDDDDADWSLLQTGDRIYILDHMGARPLRLNAFGEKRVESTVCEFDQKSALRQIIHPSTNDDVCDAAVQGTLNYVTFDVPYSIDAATVRAAGYERAEPGDAAAVLDINNDGQPRKVIKLQYPSDSDSGCDGSSLAVLASAGDSIDSSLTGFLQARVGCDGSSNSVFAFVGKVYVERMFDPRDSSDTRRILQLDHRQLKTVCAIETRTESQYVQRSLIDRLKRDADAHDPGYPLNRYVMAFSGIEAAKALFEASRRTVNPIPLAYPSAQDPEGESILVSAVKARRYDVLRFLLDNGVAADLGNYTSQSADDPRVTPLWVAVKANDLTAALILLEHGADPNGPSEYRFQTLLGASYDSSTVAMFQVLLDHGADPALVRASVRDIVQRRPDAGAQLQKVDLLLRRGADPDQWMRTLYEAISDRSDLPGIRQYLGNSQGLLATGAATVPIKTVWVDDLLESPARAVDNGLEPLLREANAIRDAADCPAEATDEQQRSCLPATLVRVEHQLGQLQSVGQGASSVTDWRQDRADRCALKTFATEDSGGWISYVLSDPKRATCVVRETAGRVASLERQQATPGQ